MRKWYTLELNYCPDLDYEEMRDHVDEILEGTVHPIFFSCHGHILVSTSFVGCAICIWDMKTGELLKRYNNAEEERYTNLLPDGNDATDMTYLESLNAFLCIVTTYLGCNPMQFQRIST